MLNILFTKTNKLLSWFPSAAEGDLIVGKLAPLFKTGESLLTPDDLKMYIAVYFGSILFFAFAYFFWEMVFKLSGSKMYLERTDDQRVYLINMWMEQTHHIIIPILCYWVLYVSCGNEEGWPWLSEKGGSYTSLNSDKRWGYFKDDVCFMEYNKGYGLILAVTNGYLTFGFYILRNWIKQKTKLN